MTTPLNAYLSQTQVSFSQVLFTHFQDTDLTQSEFLVYLYLTQWGQTHLEAPTPQALAQALKLSPSAIYSALNTLIQKEAVALITTDDGHGHMVDHYDVSPLVARLLPTAAHTAAKPLEQPDSGAIFSQIEIEFGRPLSPIEQQTIAQWLNIDHYQPAVIQLALREAVLNSAYSLRYMDRVLLNWEKQHLTTPQQIQAYQDKQKRL